MEGCPVPLSPGLDSHGGDNERPPLRYVQMRATVVAAPDVLHPAQEPVEVGDGTR